MHTVASRTAHDAARPGDGTFSSFNCGLLPFTPQLSARITPDRSASRSAEHDDHTDEPAGWAAGAGHPPAGLGPTTPRSATSARTRPSRPAAARPRRSSAGGGDLPLWSQALERLRRPAPAGGPGLPDLGIDLRGPVALKLIGRLGIAPPSRNIVSFHGLPDIPFSASTLSFPGGPGGLVTAGRDVCEPPPLVFDGRFRALRQQQHHGGARHRRLRRVARTAAARASRGEDRARPAGLRRADDEARSRRRGEAAPGEAEAAARARLRPRPCVRPEAKVKAGGGKASVEQSRRALKLKAKQR